jgi:hypothetical protein
MNSDMEINFYMKIVVFDEIYYSYLETENWDMEHLQPPCDMVVVV